MRNHTREAIAKYYDWIEKMKPDFKLFYLKVMAQQVTRSSIPAISVGEFDTMHRKYPNAFATNNKGQIEVKSIDKLPASLFNLNQK